MAISVLFPKKNRSIGGLTIETTLSENHNFTSTATRFPVEGGAVMTDHIVNDPEKIKLDGFISNTPIGGGVDNFAHDAFQALYEMWEAKELVTVATEYKVYSDMAITDITVPRNAKTGQAIQFSVELMKIRKLDSSTVSIEDAQGNSDQGQVTAGPADETTTALTTASLLEYHEGVA